MKPRPASALLLTKGAVPAPLHQREGERLARLHDYEILDTEPGEAFNNLIALAAHLTGTPLGAISFVDRDRQWFKATHGFADKQTDRSIAFCAHAILETGPAFIVPDAAQDKRFSGNPLVTGPPHIRFYAGVPMLSPDGLPVGSFCVMDRGPRTLTTEQADVLRRLARIAMDLVEAERHATLLEKHLVLGPGGGGELPEAISAMAAAKGPLHGLLDSLVGLYGPLLDGVHVRVHRFRGNFPLEAFYLPEDPPPPDHARVWTAADRVLRPTGQTLRRGIMEVDGARRYYGCIPVAFSGRALARVDFISTVRDNPCFENLFKLMLSAFLAMAEREVRAQELRFKTDHDPLTGLPNRLPLVAELARSIRAADPARPDEALAHLHLEGLVEINDNFGYAAGDRVLVEAAARLSALPGDGHFTARISGDKFLVLLRGVDRVAPLGRMLDTLDAALERPFAVDGETVRLHASIGCAPIDNPALHPVEILRRADVAMRQASAQPLRTGPAVVVYVDTMFRERQQRHHTNLLVRQAYNEQRFFLLFQPVVDLEHHRLAGAEGLLRMRQPDGSVTPAAEFMPAVERIRYQAMIDEWVFGEFIRLFRADGPGHSLLQRDDFRAALNATPALLSLTGFAGRWLGQLAAAAIPADRLVVELLESAALWQNSALARNLQELRDAGVRIAVDDFGSGYSNLRHLAQLPFDIVKLDRVFLEKFDDPRQRSHILLANMITLCHELGYAPLAEGVETAAQDTLLRQKHCRYAQGHFYAHAMPLEELLHHTAGFPPAR